MLPAFLPLLLSQGAAQNTGVAIYDKPLPWSSDVGPDVPAFWVRPGYRVTLVAKDLGNARFMAFDPKGDLFLSRPDKGDILRLVKKGDGYAVANTFVSGYRQVHGMDVADGWLWFTRSGSVHKARIMPDGTAGPVVDVLTDLPQGGHWWRPILVVKDGFFTGIGDAGNLTEPTGRNEDREKIWKYSLDGKTRTLWASGIRNTEKYGLRPGTDELYGADHGSDWYGGKLGEADKKPQPVTDAYPPCEFNRYVKGGFYGHPYFVGQNVPRLEFLDKPEMDEIAKTAIPPVWPLGPHWAPNGWTFTTKGDWAGDAIVANHGSWNRSVKSGYRVERIAFDKATGQPYGSLMLVGELGKDGGVLGRPVDVVEEPSGSLLFSDDGTNRIYRISKVK